MRVVCETCGAGFDLNDYLGASRLTQGLIRKEEIEHYDQTQTRFLGTCDSCKPRGGGVVDPDAAAEPLVRRGSEYQIAASVQRRLRELGKAHPDWSRERCSEQAVEDVNDPSFEPNAAYRSYLLGTAPNHVTAVEVAEVHRLLEPPDVTVDVFTAHTPAS